MLPKFSCCDQESFLLFDVFTGNQHAIISRPAFQFFTILIHSILEWPEDGRISVKVVSSMNLWTQHDGLRSSIFKVTNASGPSQVPCGKPALSFRHPEYNWPILTLCSRSFTKEKIRERPMVSTAVPIYQTTLKHGFHCRIVSYFAYAHQLPRGSSPWPLNSHEGQIVGRHEVG